MLPKFQRRVIPMASKGTEEKIKALAYKYYLERGKKDGFDQVDWSRATKAVQHEECFHLASLLLLLVAAFCLYLERG